MNERSKSYRENPKYKAVEQALRCAREELADRAHILGGHVSDNPVVNIDVNELMTGSINRMSHVYRYSSLPTCRRENVAEHSWYVAFYAYLIARDLMQQGCPVDTWKLLSRALVHDLDESMTGDFLRYVKYGHPDLKRALDEVSVSMIDQMTYKLRSGGEAVKRDWCNAKAADLEGDIIQVADLARVLSYVWEEVNTGNSHVRHIMTECANYIKEFIKSRSASSVVPYAEEIVKWVAEQLES